ncbi:MAG: acetyl-CoA carboxylase biotin carboxylase subunit [Streptosporangiales bacterium]|nr:acetyl-CoA carboxylase biotin carboxylase subunit [Streptosporangiales bacterium]
MSLRRLLVANRGEIAVRVIRACRALGIEAVAAVSEADKGSLPARLADRAVCVGPPRSAQSYLNRQALLATAIGTGCDSVHPGYGFLSENAAFAAACEDAGLTFVGPRSETVREMGDKLSARRLAERHGVPVVPGGTAPGGPADAVAVAERLGYPVLIKAAAGGGGRGIRVVHEPDELPAAFTGAAAEAEVAFGDGTLYVERYVAQGRHLEVQVFGDGKGEVLHLGERDCSLQRRYQKIVEEAPATGVPEDIRTRARDAAVRLATNIGYRQAGTVEFIVDQDRGEFYFLEMNTRIQVEHPVTEQITGIDLVQLQLRLAGGEPLALGQRDVGFAGHAIECRITAERPADGFRPSPGTITGWRPPYGPGIRLDTHCEPGYRVPPYYDSMLAKLIVHGRDRADATARTLAALADFEIDGIDTNLAFLRAVLAHPDFAADRITTRWVDDAMAKGEIRMPIPAEENR